jgi:hypothetical protein
MHTQWCGSGFEEEEMFFHSWLVATHLFGAQAHYPVTPTLQGYTCNVSIFALTH